MNALALEGLINQISPNKAQKGPPPDKIIDKKPAEKKSLDTSSDAFLKMYADQVTVNTLVSVQPETVSAPVAQNNRVADLKKRYVDSYAKTMSENLLVALYAQLEVGALGMVLTSAGVSREEIAALQTQSLAQARQQNEAQIKDTMYTAAVLEIAGGGKPKQVKARLRMLDQVLVKLIKQGKLLRREYSSQELAEMKLEVLQKVKAQFADEKAQLEYQLGRV